jgi:dihydrofolate synthase/folylpolyglutamate synthase
MQIDPPALTAALDRVKTLHPKVIDLSLGRIERLLADLGAPHLRVPPVIHVAGTNGKGSVVAMIRAVLEASGYRVHVYTSPHLVSFTERIRLSGSLIDAALLVDLIDYVLEINGDAPITFFEITTAVAFQAFGQIPADVLILETGLGGRLDATNVVPHPAATVLTPIGMDHMSYLGDTLSAIAGEKAAIMKPGTPCISARQHPDAAEVIKAVAAKRAVDVAWQDADWSVEADPFGTVRYKDAETEWSVLQPSLPGPHQIGNLGVALATLARLPLSIPSFGLRAGMRQIDWPARCQKLTRGPLTAGLPSGWDLWLDGGHNPPAGDALAAWLADEPAPTVLITGMMANKDITGFLAPIAPHAQALAAVSIPNHEDGCATPEDIASAASRAGIQDTLAARDLAAARDALTPHISGHRGRVLICGSLYLAGEVLKTHG